VTSPGPGIQYRLAPALDDAPHTTSLLQNLPWIDIYALKIVMGFPRNTRNMQKRINKPNGIGNLLNVLKLTRLL
jgi:hypothetical protein